MSSINTNRSALQALQSVNAAANELAAVERRVATGLKVGGAMDNGAVYAIAQNMRSQVAGWGAVTTGLSRGQSALDVASTASGAISDLMIELQQKAVAFTDAQDDRSRSALKADMEALLKQVDQGARSATFDGINLLTGRAALKTVTTSTYGLPSSTLTPPGFGVTMAALPPGSTAYTAQSAVLALPDSPLTPPSFAAALAQVSGSNSQTITVDAGAAAGRVSLLLDAYGVADIAEIWQNGVRVAATGQPPGVAGAAVGAGSAVAYESILSFDYDPANGQNLEFRFNENVSISGSAWRVGGLVLGDPSDPPPALAPVISSTTQIQTGAAFDPPTTTTDPEQVAQILGTPPGNVAATYTVNGGAQAGRVDMLFDAFGLADRVDIFQNGVRIGASGQTYAPGGGAVGAATDVTGKQVISFDYDPADGPLTFQFNNGVANPDSAWVVGALTLQPTSAPLPAGQVNTTDQQIAGFGPVHYDFQSSLKGDAMRVSSRDLTPLGLGLDPLDWENPARILASVRAAGIAVVEAATYFGQQGRLFDAVLSQATTLTDTLQTGVGNLVDADMAKEAARLQAAQIRQQLATQTLSIANGEPQWLLGLFKG